MKTISIDLAKALLDFAPTKKARDMGFGASQLEGTVAAYNMIARNRIAYIADEVGMGKTFVALGVLGIMRYINPGLRAMVIAPRENIQRKWIKELCNLVRVNWREEGLRFKGLNQRPVHEPVPCDSLETLAREARINDGRDFFLKMTSFSISTKDGDRRRQYRDRLERLLPPFTRDLLQIGRDPDVFRDNVGKALNSVFPDVDLLIIDEAHNLKHGFGVNVSNRNRILGFALGHPDGELASMPWYGKRFKYLLLLSATPFEYDYADIYRQLDVLGLGNISLADAEGRDPIDARILMEPGDEDTPKKEKLISRMLLRRVQYLNIGGVDYSKNMYRREWRGGGLRQHDQPMSLTDTKQRLIVGLIQKKVAEILGDSRFNNSFQIGMLSSFESFVATLAKRNQKAPGDDDDSDPTFDNSEQADKPEEKQGIDTDSVAQINQSYRETFNGKSLPHPKLDSTAGALAKSFESGEKSLVFVRRIATVWELKEKLDRHFDSWLRGKINRAVPSLSAEFDALFQQHEEERQQLRPEDLASFGDADVDPSEKAGTGEDEGGADTFFAWFFRGKRGPRGVLSGAAFQKNRLSSDSSLLATFFEDNYIHWLLGRPADVVGSFAELVGMPHGNLCKDLRRRAYGYFRKRTRRKEGYPRLYIHEAYQAACLQLLSETSLPIGKLAGVIFNSCFSDVKMEPLDPLAGFPSFEDSVDTTTFPVELSKDPELQRRVWPDEQASEMVARARGGEAIPPEGVRTFQALFLTRERRRLMLSAITRLGLSFIDLYLLAIRSASSIRGGADRRSDEDVSGRKSLPKEFVDLLRQQQATRGYDAFHELSLVSESFDLILSVNFHDIHSLQLSEAAMLFARTLQHQVPVGGMWGGVNKRLVQQFRMPGFPSVLVTTDVLQEGEDLHTFCKDVIHYGIAWTPSAVEQRTGRIDRIGSLVQRTLDGRDQPPAEEELIQVYYPHLVDTVEVLQVRRVLERLNRFLKLIHRTRPDRQTEDSRIRVEDEILRLQKTVPVITGLLKSAFPVTEEWKQGEMDASYVVQQDIRRFDKAFESFWQHLKTKYLISPLETGHTRHYSGVMSVRRDALVRASETRSLGSCRNQKVDLRLESRVVGKYIRLHCSSPVGCLNLDNDERLNDLYNYLQGENNIRCISARRIASHPGERLLTVEVDLFLDPSAHTFDHLERKVVDTVTFADRLEKALLQKDEDVLLKNGDDEEWND